MEQAFIGVDVGTASARAGMFAADGTLLATARRPIAIWHEAGDIVEQSSADIWAACTEAVRAVLNEAGQSPSSVKGIGFDATCSLVVLDGAGNPLSVSLSGDPHRNIIVWMDHRAIPQADRISATGDEVLRHVGGIISPEMETPKLLWLKEHLPATYHAAGHFFDLADYLTYRATGRTTRSACTLTCKWTYLAHERRWSHRYFERIGLPDLLISNCRRIGSEIVEPGTALGEGLLPESAVALGLLPGTPVGAALIDAHAGGIGTVGGEGAERARERARSPGVYHGHFGLHHGDNRDAALRAGGLGTVFLGDDPRSVVERRRPIGGWGRDRAHRALASGARRSRGGRKSC